MKTKLAGLCLILMSLFCAPRPAVGAEGLVGGVFVKTDPPGATISVFREEVGTSPCKLTDIGIGDVTITATKKGYKEATKEIDVPAEKIAKVEMTLSELDNVGHLMVNVKPEGSQVSVDRTPRGQTPKEVINLSAGTHRLTVTREGYHSRSRLIKIFPGRQVAIRGKLRRREGSVGGNEGGLTIQVGEDEGQLSPHEMPEEQAFQPVRRLVSKGKLQKALGKLDEIAASDKGARYATRIARDRVVIGFMKKVMDAAWLQLQTMAGEEATIPTKIGAQFSGQLRNVNSKGADVKLPGNGRTVTIEKSEVRTQKIIKLASKQLDADTPEMKAKVAAYYAGQDMLDKASQLLKEALEADYDAQEVRSYIRTERMWERAKRQAEKSRSAARAEQQHKVGSRASEPALILVHASDDAFKGGPVVGRLKAKKATLLREKEPFVGRDLWEVDAVMLGAADQPTVYSRREMQRALQFVRSGGGLVILNPEPPDDEKALRNGMPVISLLQAFGIGRPNVSVNLVENRPGGIPGNKLLCQPASPHFIVRGANGVLFPRGTAPLVLRGGGAPLLVTHRFVKAKGGNPPFLLAAAVQHGNGRVVVFSRPPERNDSSRGKLGTRVVTRAVLWAAGKR